MKMRLQKIIAQAGVASRREAERLIEDGKVAVNGKTVRKLGVSADPSVDKIKVNGRLLHAPETQVYIILNKPQGCVSTTKDERGRKTVLDCIKKVKERVFPVGRLDYNTEGLLLLTNDGSLSKKLLDPKYKIPRTYMAKVRGIPEDKALNRLRKGVRLDNKPTKPMDASRFRTTGKNCFITLKLVEGKYRHIKRVCEKVGHPVVKLKRIKFAGLTLVDLPVEAYRSLTPREIKSLRSQVSKEK